MILNWLVVLSCVAACLGEDYHSYYVPEHPQQVVNEHYSDGNNYGLQGVREYDHGDNRHLKSIHNSHGSRDFGAGENHALRDIAKQANHNQGAHAQVHSSGGQHNQIRESHDKGFYEREKKYGYEKAYGYERETKHHDKADNAQSHGSGYNHNENKGHYNQGGQAVRDLATNGNRYKHDSDSHGNQNVLIDLGGNHNRGKELISQYNNGHQLRNLDLIRRPEHIQRYMPLYLNRDHINGIDGSLARFRYLSGIHGLGGLRGYGLGYGYNPLRYGGSPLSHNGNIGYGVIYPTQPLVNEEQPLIHEPLVNIEDPVSRGYYINP